MAGMGDKLPSEGGLPHLAGAYKGDDGIPGEQVGQLVEMPATRQNHTLNILENRKMHYRFSRNGRVHPAHARQTWHRLCRLCRMVKGMHSGCEEAVPHIGEVVHGVIFPRRLQ
jgi:hypothetical protein